MATGLDIVNAALRRIGVVSEDEDASGDALTNGINAMNRMAEGWAARGVDVSWSTIASGDTFPLAAQYEDHFIWLLADLLSEDNSSARPPSRKHVYDAWDIMRAKFHTRPTSTIDDGLQKLPSRNLTSWWFR